jgi:hypothetical protein
MGFVKGYILMTLCMYCALHVYLELRTLYALLSFNSHTNP